MRGEELLLEEAPGEDLGVLVPGAVEDPAAPLRAHAAHVAEAGGEEVKLEAEGVLRLGAGVGAVEAGEPGVVVVDRLQRGLETEATREGGRERGLAGADHAGDGEEERARHRPTKLAAPRRAAGL
ncbi:MAG: hypothetical protein MUF40_04920 [Gemmatimonadaceae bacterium]|nr:hypothetical protein [Gemmatimonadaceae bacterium]